jgi:hypothetical protein
VPTANVDVELFRGSAKSCYYRNRVQALRGALLGGRYSRGKAAETIAVRNRRSGGMYVFACVYKPRDIDARASYSLSVTTTSNQSAKTASHPREKGSS